METTPNANPRGPALPGRKREAIGIVLVALALAAGVVIIHLLLPSP